MKKLALGLAISISLIFLSFKTDKSNVTIKEVIVKAPFEMPSIKTPDFSNCKKLSIVDFGAIKGNKVKTSAAINKAIDKANKMGGGIVVIPEGEWLTTKIHFKSNVNLHLEKNALLLFSKNFDDYKIIEGNYEGVPSAKNESPIMGTNLQNIAITGQGTIDGINGISLYLFCCIPIGRKTITHF